MKRKFSILIAFTAIILFLAHCSSNTGPVVQGPNTDSIIAKYAYGGFGSSEKWGEHLVNTGGCNDCHTPRKMGPMGPVMDSSMLLSGHPAKMPPPDINRKEIQKKGLAVTQTLTAWVGPWGISYAANLTSDSTGIGGWKESQFLYALRYGKYMGLPDARPILPPMPWETIRNYSDDELKAIFAYLKTVKPVNNVVPTWAPPAK